MLWEDVCWHKKLSVSAVRVAQARSSDHSSLRSSGASVPLTFAHPGGPCLRIALYV